MTKCTDFTREGVPCKGIATGRSGLCPAHDPARAKARSASASKAGKSKGGTSTGVDGVKAQLQAIIDRVLSDDEETRLDTKVAAVAGQLLNCMLRALEVERKIREADELEVRLSEMEAALDGNTRSVYDQRLKEINAETRRMEEKVDEWIKQQEKGRAA